MERISNTPVKTITQKDIAEPEQSGKEAVKNKFGELK
jgi:hypothetical protein